MYTKEQNEEIEKVCRVFDSYIRENPYFDVVWSDKLGYIYLSGIAPDREGVCMAPLILRTGEDLCEEIIYNMAADILKQIGQWQSASSMEQLIRIWTYCMNSMKIEILHQSNCLKKCNGLM